MRNDHPNEPVPRQGEQPAHLACQGCGREWPWVWYAPHHGAYPHRWCAPKVNPCKLCASMPDQDEERAVRERLRDAGIPEPLWWVRLEEDSLCVQRDDEEPADHQDRARHERRLGITVGSREALRTAWRWSPPKWLVLDGPPGVGKTTWLAGLARRLLTRPPETWTTTAGAGDLPLPGQRTLQRKPLRQVRYHRVDELLERERVKLRGLDPHPTVDVAKVGVLLLDELGLNQRPTEGEVKLVERILCYRHDHGLPTVVATNRTREELVSARGLYGARVADRLRGAVSATLGGLSWREAA